VQDSSPTPWPSYHLTVDQEWATADPRFRCVLRTPPVLVPPTGSFEATASPSSNQQYDRAREALDNYTQIYFATRQIFDDSVMNLVPQVAHYYDGGARWRELHMELFHHLNPAPQTYASRLGLTYFSQPAPTVGNNISFEEAANAAKLSPVFRISTEADVARYREQCRLLERVTPGEFQPPQP